MTLSKLFRLHALLAAIYAMCLIFAPTLVVGLLSDEPLGRVGTDVTRLFGAALVLITLIAWTASRMNDVAARRTIAVSLFVYTTLGAIITILGQLAGIWGVLGWSNVVSYLIFVFGYGFFLFVKPETMAEGK